MVQTIDILHNIKKDLSEEDWKVLEPVIAVLDDPQNRRARKNLVTDLNKLILDTAIRDNRPALPAALQEIERSDNEDLFSRIIRQYILTKDRRWLETVFVLSDKISKKSNQSRVFAMLARDLIDAGVSEAAPDLIDQGLLLLDRISFRKYRSDIMIDIIPLLIVWAITTRSQNLLRTSLHLIEEIGDISKRAVLHAELAKALATVAILDKDRPLFLDSIRSATSIHQKIRRHNCISEIIGKGAKTAFGKDMADIPRFLEHFSAISHDAFLEIVSALTEQLLERVKDKQQIITILQQLCHDKPEVTGTLVIDLLKKAERSGDQWFLSTAMDLQQHISDNEDFPVREMVHAGVAVANNSNDMQVLTELIPILERHCNPAILSRIYLQFSQIMLASGNFSYALGIFGKINHEIENASQYTDCLTQLLKEGVLNDSVPLIHNNILIKLHPDVVNTAVYRATIELSRESSYHDLILHILSIRNLILLHPKQDHLILESITFLVDRGFLDSHDPGILIRFAESIREQALKERAIANIVIKIAKIGVKVKNRDFLQRAVGLTCEIEGQNTRSATLSSIIDEASILAAQQGDLDLLLRMKAWSNSLLEKDLVSYAMANIIDGVIKYATDKQSCDALEEAYLIAGEINDPSLKGQLFERIAECFVKIGCALLNDPSFISSTQEFGVKYSPFVRGREVIRKHVKPQQASLKIAGIIDIIISCSRTSTSLDYIIPLALFATEIENTFERDAMMSRIVSNLNDEITHPNSTDPYETMAFLLRRNELAHSNPEIIALIYTVLLLIYDPYVRLTGLCDLADMFSRLQKTDDARRVLEEVEKNLDILNSGYHKVLILSYLASSYSQVDEGIAEKNLARAIQHLEETEFDKDSEARRQVIKTIVRFNTIRPESRWFTTAFQIAQKIKDPAEYANSLISLYRMIRTDTEKRRDLIRAMEAAADTVITPYEKASVILSIVRLTLQNADGELTLRLLKKAETLTKKINIPSIADTIRNNIADIYSGLHEQSHDRKMRDLAIQVIKTIDADEVRLFRLEQMGYTEMYEITPQFVKIKSVSERMVKEGIHPNSVATLERLVRAVADRGKEAIFFCYLSVYFKKEGQDKLSRKMLQNSIKEARIIRPLSRRAFVMCDIALKIFAAGCEHSAQEILDYAIDAATNIRQSTLRDEVFDELGLAIKIMQRM
ncbi:hypothetical protein [Methanoregula sp.]|uniref:hypothetical protein n=1 Tax=Methanoregula sp. TaxID=2052170 RepID=UPI000CC299FD|nr:hypothetical protein [Methanoregula sp.]PKG33773.1 MAG: hypothetical protein CW742_01260 [Methanoregula sp.]